MILIINHNWIALAWTSINLPAIHGIVKALIPKHWEYKAIADPLFLLGDDLIIKSEAEGRKAHNEIVMGIKAIKTNW